MFFNHGIDNYQTINIASMVTDHMMLQATELGLGSVWICKFEPDIVRREFSLPDNLEPINILGTRELTEDDLATDVQTAIKDEFETLDWIMEGLIRRAGFNIVRVEYQQGFLAEYVCKK